MREMPKLGLDHEGWMQYERIRIKYRYSSLQHNKSIYVLK